MSKHFVPFDFAVSSLGGRNEKLVAVFSKYNFAFRWQINWSIKQGCLLFLLCHHLPHYLLSFGEESAMLQHVVSAGKKKNRMLTVSNVTPTLCLPVTHDGIEGLEAPNRNVGQTRL